jgi:3-oxoacyl-(acyl-carrier-protein) synthase
LPQFTENGKLLPRGLALALAATGKLKRPKWKRPAVVLGLPSLHSETAYMEHILEHRGEAEAMAHVAAFDRDLPLRMVQQKLDSSGPCLRIDSACATGNDALIIAKRWMDQSGLDDVVVVAASAMLSPVGTALFHHLKAIHATDDDFASCPFDARRRGFVMGEGAAAVWLSRGHHDDALGYLAGAGQSMNPGHLVDIPEDISPLIHAVNQARGEHEPSYVNAHGTATWNNDLRETQLQKAIYGDKAYGIPMSSIKSMIGHCLGASSLIEAIASLYALRDEMAPPTIHLDQPDPQCDLNYVPNQPQPIKNGMVLSHAFAFGGQNSVVALTREPPCF